MIRAITGSVTTRIRLLESCIGQRTKLRNLVEWYQLLRVGGRRGEKSDRLINMRRVNNTRARTAGFFLFLWTVFGHLIDDQDRFYRTN